MDILMQKRLLTQRSPHAVEEHHKGSRSDPDRCLSRFRAQGRGLPKIPPPYKIQVYLHLVIVQLSEERKEISHENESTLQTRF